MKDFLDILAVIRPLAYTEKNIVGGWRGVGIEPYSVSAIIKRVEPGFETTPPPLIKRRQEDIYALRTPKTTRKVDRVVGGYYDTQESPERARAIRLLTSATKQSIEAARILRQEKEAIYGVQKAQPKRRVKADTSRGLIMTAQKAGEIQAEQARRLDIEARKERHRQAYQARLRALQARGECLQNKRCPRKRLMILPACIRNDHTTEGGID
jgi:hypothetical protein